MLVSMVQPFSELTRRKSKSVAWHEYEKYNQAYTDEDGHQQHHDGTLVHEFADVRFSDPGPIHEGVFAEASKGEDGINGVLL